MDLILSLITKNSYSKLKQTPISLYNVLASTEQLPYETIILVDDSDDETAEVFREWCDEKGKKLLACRSKTYGYGKPTRATARQTAVDVFLENFREGWLMFVDDDVILNRGWWSWLEDNGILNNDEVGEVWGINWDANPKRERILQIFGLDLKDYLIRKFHERGGTHDTLYKRKALEGIKIPPELHVYEDAYLHFWVICKGWESIVNPIGILHYHPTFTDLKQDKEKIECAIKEALKYGICEYEFAKIFEEGSKNKIKAYLMLARPLLGLAPMISTTVNLYGFKRGIKEALKAQYLKLWFRWKVLRNITDTNIPNVCDVLAQQGGQG